MMGEVVKTQIQRVFYFWGLQMVRPGARVGGTFVSAAMGEVGNAGNVAEAARTRSNALLVVAADGENTV